MFALPGLLALVFFDYLRPQEYFSSLSGIPLLHVAAAAAVFGLVLDLRMGLSRREPAPHLILVVLLLGWCLVTLLLRARDQLGPRAQALIIPLLVYALVSHGVQSFRMLQVLCGFVLATSLVLAALGVVQGLAPWGCHRVAARQGGLAYVYDGRPCAEGIDRDCEGDAAEPGAEYACEKVGLLGTSSIRGRVRYRGSLQDPNELALTLGIAVPFAFALFDRRRTAARLLLVAVTIGLVGLCTYFTESRGGQLVFLTVLAVYLVRRMGARRGIALGVMLALPLLLFGGRSGGEADASTLERVEAWWVGLHLLTNSPVFGVGFGQFTDHHYLTAHNSPILVAAELGLPGFLLWSAIIYLGIKIPIQAMHLELPHVARAWALALLASTLGLLVGGMFLSFAYKDVFWIYVGLPGVLYHAIRGHAPDFRVRFGFRDLALVAAVDGALLLLLAGYTIRKMGW